MNDKKEDVKKQKEDKKKEILMFLGVGAVTFVKMCQKWKINTPERFFWACLLAGMFFVVYLLLNKFAGVWGIIGALAILGGIVVHECTFLFILGLIVGITLICTFREI